MVAAQLLITKPIDGIPATAANGGMIGIAAAIRYQVLAWHKASNTHGGTAIKSPTSERPNGAFVAFLRDPDGNRLTARTQPTGRMSRVIERTSSAAARAVGADSCDIKTSSAQIDLFDDAPGYREAESSTPRQKRN